MNFTNINDPAGVKALLEQLRSSQAWQEIAQPQPELAPSIHDAHVPAASPSTTVSQTTGVAVQLQSTSESGETSGILSAAHAPNHDVPTTSVASLLSQLQASTSMSPILIQPAVSQPAVPNSSPPFPSTSYHAVPEARPIAHTPVTLPSSARNDDLRNCTFQQALPHLARLSEDPDFVDAISTLKKEQADLERQLWDERRAIQRKQEEKVKVARTKASMIGSGLTQFEADMMSDTFRKELRKFDMERVLPAWDGLVSKQQVKLESLGVPAMYPTTMKADKERQQRVIQVLAGIESSE